MGGARPGRLRRRAAAMSVTWEHSEDIVLQTSWAICLTVMPNEDEGEHDKKFVWGGLNNTVSVVGTGATESVKYHGHGAFVAAVSVAPDKKTIASGGGDGLVKIWRDGECVQTLNKHGGSAVAPCGVPAVAWPARSAPPLRRAPSPARSRSGWPRIGQAPVHRIPAGPVPGRCGR